MSGLVQRVSNMPKKYSNISSGMKTLNQPASPTATTPDQTYDPNAPPGFPDFGSLLAYWVNRNRPTYRMADMASNMGLLAVESVTIVMIVGVPNGYFYLHKSLVPQCWFYVYRYVLNNMVAPPASVGPAAGDYEYVMIQKDTSLPPWQSAISAALPPAIMDNHNLVPLTTGTVGCNPF
jgi:hypothetical protein